MDNATANRLRLCLVCGEPDAILLRLRDGRNVRACETCLQSGYAREWLNGSVVREPMDCELPFSSSGFELVAQRWRSNGIQEDRIWHGQWETAKGMAGQLVFEPGVNRVWITNLDTKKAEDFS